jgi:hypothetical protein
VLRLQHFEEVSRVFSGIERCPLQFTNCFDSRLDEFNKRNRYVIPSFRVDLQNGLLLSDAIWFFLTKPSIKGLLKL